MSRRIRIRRRKHAKLLTSAGPSPEKLYSISWKQSTMDWAFHLKSSCRDAFIIHLHPEEDLSSVNLRTEGQKFIKQMHRRLQISYLTCKWSCFSNMISRGSQVLYSLTYKRSRVQGLDVQEVQVAVICQKSQIQNLAYQW